LFNFIASRNDQIFERNPAMATHNTWHGPAGYQIKVKGRLGSQWSDWFEGMAIESEAAVTTLTGQVADQSALHGLLVRVRDLGLPLISVKRVESKQKQKKPVTRPEKRVSHERFEP
jgi:hypothetical protein